MKIHGIFKTLIVLAMASNALAGDINWSGRFNFESQLVKNPNLATENKYSFFYHHLILNPKIVAADGLTVYTRFDLFNHDEYQNNQFGEFYGGSKPTTTNKGITGELESETIAVTDLYLTWSQQYGSLIAGRAPVQFGLGLTHNAGNGEFDHWLDRKDLIGYKVILGNFYFFPMYGKVKEGQAGEDDDIKEYLAQVGYENFDTDLEMGFFFQNRKASPAGNDTSIPSTHFNVDAVLATGQLDIKTYNLFVRKKVGNFQIALEGSIQDGETGLRNAGSNEGVTLDGFAVVGEFSHAREGSKWDTELKIGMVSGDDPGTQNVYEGYLVDKNYDVGLIMFNYYLGNPGTTFGAANTNDRGFLGSENYIRGTTSRQDADVGYLTNTLFVAPGFKWKWSDKWGMNGRFVWAKLQEEQYKGQDTDLGYELDLGFYHKPIERFTIRLDAGYYFTGDAYKGNPTATGANAQKVDDVYGIFTKAALSF